MRAISDVVQVMVEGVREGKVINLNAVKNEAARRYGGGAGRGGLEGVPCTKTH